MTTKPLPKGYKLARGVDKSVLFSDEYEHWTVADLIEILQDHPQDSRVWVQDRRGRVAPLECVFGGDGELVL